MSGVHLFLRVNKEPSAVLEFVERVRRCCSGFHRDERTVDAVRHVTLVGLILQEPVRHDCLTGTDVHHVCTHAHDAARGDSELQLYAVVHEFHLRHLAFVNGHELDDLTRAVFRRIHRQLLHGFALHAVDLLDDHLRLTYLQLVALATHRLDQYRQVQHSATKHVPRRLSVAGFYAQGEVLFQLFRQSLLDVARGNELAVLPEER